jgi:pilus assembly protein CpaB
MKGKPAILIAILFGILGFVFVHLYLRSREAQLLQIADERTVVVAVSDILPGTAIEENMVVETEVPLKFVQPSAFTSAREVVGQIAAIPIQKDSQVLGTAMTSVGRSLATKIPRGMRAVSLAVSDVTGVASLVAANNYVDVLATVKLGSGLGSSNQRTFVTTLFQNVMVLAVGSDLGEVRNTTPEENAMEALARQEQRRFSTVTLALSPQQAQDLVLVQDIGDITLALRSFRDENETAAIPRSSANAVFGVPEGEVVPRRMPSWQEIRSTAR